MPESHCDRPDLQFLQGWIDAITTDMIRLQDHKQQGQSESKVLETLGCYIADWHRDYKKFFPQNSSSCEPFFRDDPA